VKELQAIGIWETRGTEICLRRSSRQKAVVVVFLSERIYGRIGEVWIVPASSTSKDLPRTWTSELHNSGSGSSDSEKDSRRSVNAWIMKLM